MRNRNASEKEIKKVIQKGKWEPAERGRFTAYLHFPFDAKHYGRYYKIKEVVPIFIEEEDKIIVITVYTFFSQGK